MATKYIFGADRRIAKITDGEGIQYFSKDHLGSSTVVTDDSGAVVEQADYRPFGEDRFYTGSVATPTPYKYTDQELDPSTGLYNYDARHYDPAIGRFISPDSLIPNLYDPQQLNPYAYCRNNPLIYVDPTGHWTNEDSCGGNSYTAEGEGNASSTGPNSDGYWGDSPAPNSNEASYQPNSSDAGWQPNRSMAEARDYDYYRNGYQGVCDPTVEDAVCVVADVTTIVDILDGPQPDVAIVGQVLKNIVKTKAKKKAKKGFLKGLLSKIKGIFSKGVKLTDAQAKRMKKIQEINHNFTVRKTLSGEMLDANHAKKISQAIDGLTKHKNALENSLKNPNLNSATRKAIQDSIDTANDIIGRGRSLIQ
ncbi:RHS repeat-associated core domain-containing protein [Desulfatibacillum alkenivorans DSM 16219]|uniref:RHS repeat-associated core domain-containing protein n=1 Tax=Desulfatibacillum alkenivorans DSM 16219 TaxID=1121393 RepID=A0A1M6YHN7_9BACT|nr:RHS repeat-associated core domain-containing protein [Desulfatibacillum alkenivorans]SHL17811.1 RHS repeat-associated core domain-containing protein [Desulfatibacillum alkenivorans DSM 16219]